MKSIKLVKAGCIVILLLTLNSCCWFNKCECEDPITTEDQTSINFFDTNPWSYYYNSVVLSFQFSQEKIDYGFDCDPDQSSTSLVIRNVISQSITLDYNITAYGANSGQLLWSYQGVSSIPAFGSLTIGKINSDPVYLNQNVIYIQSANITYY